MADFTARFVAHLDRKSFDNEINGILSKRNSINISLNTQLINRQISTLRQQIKGLSNISINLKASNARNSNAAQINEITDAYRDLMNIARRANSTRVQIGGLDATKNIAQINELHRQLNGLMTDYHNLYNTFNGSFSTNQIDNLNRVFDVASGKVESLSAKLRDTSSIQSTTAAFNELLSVASKIDALEIKIKGLDANTNSGQISVLQSQLDQLRTTYQSLFSASKGNLSSDQFAELGSSADETMDKISQLNAKLEDSRRVLAESINVKLDNGEISSTIASITAQYEKLGASRHSMLGQVNADISELSVIQNEMLSSSDSSMLISNYERYNAVLDRVKNTLTTISAESKTYASSLQITTLDNKMSTWLNENSRASRMFGSSIGDLRNRLATLSKSGNVTTSDLRKLEEEFKRIQQEAIKTGQTGSSLGDKFSRVFGDLSRYFSAYTVLSQISQALRQMYENVVLIDTAMTELRKVTDESNDTYATFLSDAGDSAKKIGTTIDDLINSTADFARLGFSFVDSQELAKIANIYAVVGDDIADIDTATKSLISTMTAFDVEASNAISIVDKFNEIGNTFAISSGGIGEALEKSASSLAAANNTLDQSIALITAANTVVQDPNSVGQAFKTISMRIRGAKTELEEAGLETDGMAESTAKLRKEVKALSGVDIMLDNDTFKSTYDILDQLSRKWVDLTDIQQASLTELIAGKRQGNVVSSLMENFDIARKALDSAASSEGSAMAEHAKWMESIEARITQLNGVWQDFSNDFINSDFVKIGVSTLTGFLEVLDSIVESFGGLGTIGLGVGAFAIFKNIGNIKTFVQTILGATSSLGDLKAALALGAQGFKSFMQTPLGAATAVGAVVVAINFAVNAYNKYKQKQAEIRQEIMQSAQVVMDEQDAFEKSYITIQKYLGNANLTEEQEAELRTAIDSCSEALEGKTIALNAAREEQEKYNESLSQASQEELTNALANAKKNLQAAKDTLGAASYDFWSGSQITIEVDNGRTGIKELNEAREIVAESMSEYLDWGQYGRQLEPINWDADAENMDAVVDYYFELNKLVDKLALSGKTNNDIYSDAVSILGDIKAPVEAYIDAMYSELKYNYELSNGIPRTSAEYLTMRDAILSSINATTAYKDAMQSLMDEEFDDAFGTEYMNNVSNEIQKIIDNFNAYVSGKSSGVGRDAIIEGNEFKDWINGLTEDEKEIVYSISLKYDTSKFNLNDWKMAVDNYLFDSTDVDVADEYVASLYGVEKAIKSLTGGYDVLEKAQSEMNAGTGLSADTISNLSSQLEDGESIADYLTVEDGILSLNIDKWKSRSEAMISGDMSVLQAQITQLEEESYWLKLNQANYEELGKKMTEAFSGGNVDLLNRPIVLAEDMIKAGWENFDGDIATLFSSTYTAGDRTLGYDYSYDKNIVVNLTPIMADGTVLSPQELEDYLDEILRGEFDVMDMDNPINGGRGLILSVDDVGESLDAATVRAENWAMQLSAIQAEYYQVTGIERQINSLKDLLDMYQALYDSATKTVSDPFDLTQLTEGLENIASRSKTLLEVFKSLGTGEILDDVGLANLAIEYPDLMQNADLFDLSTLEGQMSLIENYINEYEAKYDELIADQIEIVQAARDSADANKEDVSAYDALISNLNILKGMNLADIYGTKETKDNTTAYEKMSVAISRVQKASDLLTKVGSSDSKPLEILSSVIDMAEESKQSITDFVTVTDGELAFNEDAITNWAKTYIESLDSTTDMDEAMKNSLIGMIKAASEAESGYNNLATAINNVKNVQSLLTDIKTGDGDSLSMFSTIVEMARDSKQSVSDFVSTVNGELKFNEDAIKSWAETWINSLDISDVPGLTEEIKTALIADVKAVEEDRNAYEKLADAISKVSSVSNYLTKISSGEVSFIDALTDAVAIMENMPDGTTFDDFFAFDESGNVSYKTDAMTNWITSYINDMAAAGDISEDVASQMILAAKAESEQANSFEQISTAIENVRKASELLTSISKGDGDILSMIQTVSDMAKSSGRDISDFVSVVDGSLQFNTNEIESWATTFVDALSTIDGMTPELIQQIKDQIGANIEAKNSYDLLSDAINNVQKASSLLADIRSGKGDSLSMFSSIVDMAKESGQSIQDFVSVVNGELEFNESAISEWANVFVQSLDKVPGMTDEIKAEIISLIDVSEEASSGFSELSDAISTIGNINGFINDAKSGDVGFLDMLSNASKIIEDMPEGTTFDDIFTISDSGDIVYNIEMLSNWIEEYIDSMVEAGIVNAETAEQMKKASTEAVNQSNGFEKLTTAISNVNSASSYLTKIEEGDVEFVDVLSDIVNMMDDMPDGTTLDDFLSFDGNGDITYKTEAVTEWINAYIDSLIEAGEVTSDVGEEMKKSAKSQVELETAFEKLTNTMEKVKNASGLVADVQEEIADSGKNSLDSLMSLMDLYGDKWQDYVDFSADGSFKINTSAIKSEMYSVIDQIDNITPEIRQSLKNTFEIEIEEGTFKDSINEYVENLDTLQDALTKIKSGDFSNHDIFDLISKFPKLASETENLGDAISGLIDSMDANIMESFNEQLESVDSDETRAELLGFMAVVASLREEVGNTEFSIDFSAESEGIKNLFTAIKESVSSVGMSSESVKNLKERYQDLANYDAASLFEKTANGIHLNTTALRELEDAYEDQTKQEIDGELKDLVEEYNNLTEQINEAGIAANTADLYAQRSKIMQRITDTSELAAQYTGLTSAFYKWEQAQSMGEEGDMYDSLAGGLENIKDLYDKGLVGTNEFRAAVQLMSNVDLSNASVDELIAAYEGSYKTMTRYFSDGSDGVLRFLGDVEDLNSEWVHMNEDGSWDIDFGVGNDQEIADALGISVEAVQAILRKLSDYGFDINLDSMYTDLGTMQTKAEKAAKALREMGATDYNFDFDSTSITRLDEQIEVAKDTLKQFTNEDGTINLEMEGAEEAQYVLATLILQKQSLDEAAILKVDAGNASGEIGEVIRQLQVIKTTYDNLQLQTAIGADTSQAQADLDAAIATMSAEHADILADLGIDTTSQETMMSTINALSPEVMVKCGLDATLVDAYQASTHDAAGTVVYNVNDSKVKSYVPPKKSGQAWYTAYMYSWTPPNKSGTVIYKASMSGSGTAAGTAHANGSAFKNGYWGTKNSGTGLGGELGQELVVRGGNFFTIGDNGAEFFKYKKGDIIFNASQTEEIFNKGKITSNFGRGKVFAEGTAFSSGSGRITASGKVKTKPTGGSTGGSGGSSGGGSASKEDKQVIDWIEVAINRIERAVESLTNAASSSYRTLQKRMTSTADAIEEVNGELLIQQQAYTRYMQEANSVGISDELKGLVQTGAIDISKYDSATAELITEYQQWYEKAMDCSDAVDTLKDKLGELYANQFDAIATDAENKLATLEHMTNSFNNTLSIISANGYLGGSNLYESLISVEKSNKQSLEAELASLVVAMSEAVNSGAIDEGSEAWYEMQQSINDVKEKIQESELAMIEYQNAIRDLDWSNFDFLLDRISAISSESDFLISLMSKSKQYNDDGELTDEGLATMGLHGINHNTYMAQAEKYAAEIAKINADMANDPNDTELIKRKEELIKLQQQSILSAEDEKQAIVDMVEEGINVELQSLRSLIDEYENSLDSAKDLYEYQKKIKTKTSDIAKLRKQLAAYSNDTSEENRKRLQTLKIDLNDAIEDLQETEYDQYIKDQKELFDTMYEGYEELLNSRLDDVDALMSDMISDINNNSTEIRDTIANECSSVGYIISDSMNDIWANGGSANGVISSVSGTLTSLASVISGIASDVANLVSAGNAAPVDETPTTATTPTPTPTTPSQTPTTPTTPQTEPPVEEPEKVKTKKVKIVSGNWNIRSGASTSKKILGVARSGDILEYAGKSSGKWNSVIYKGKTGWIYNTGSKIIEGYSGGGFIADAKKAAYANGDDIVTVNTLKKGEAVLTKDQGILFKEFVNNLPLLQGMVDINPYLAESRSANAANNVVSINMGGISIPIERVLDYNDFANQLRNDHKFEKLIQSMTVDVLAGKSKLEKHKYTWSD